MHTLQEDCNQVLETLATAIANENIVPGSLASVQQKKTEYLELFKNGVQQFKDEVIKGFTLMTDHLFSTLSNQEARLLVRDLLSLSEKLNSEEKIRAYLPKLQESKTWKEILSISASLLDHLYKPAAEFYNQGKYAEAISCFLALVWLDVKNYHNLLFLGHSYFQAARYNEAATFYILAAQLSQDTEIFLFLIHTYEKLGDTAQVQECAKIGLEEEAMQEHTDVNRLNFFKQKALR